MYKIMLADDEGIVIDSMKFIIEKEFGDSCEIQFAKTGRSVIELAEQYRPDIAVMDIQMPGINGIDAMREMRSTNSNIVFIVMSAYDKFDYAQEAIKLGVLEYITKPMDRNRVINALRHAMEVVDREKNKRSRELMIKEKLETVTPIIESGLIYNILFHDRFAEDMENYKSILEMNADHAYMMSFVCGDEQQGNHMTNAVGSSVRIQKIYNEIREYIKQYFPNAVIGTVMANKIAVLIPTADAMMDYNTRIELIDRARELVRVLRKKTDVSFRIGIGRVAPLQNQSESYEEAMNALMYTTGSVAHADDLPIGCEYADDYPIDMERALFDLVSKGELDAAVSTAKSFFDWMEQNKNGTLMDIRLKVLEFALWCEHIAYENGGMVYSFESRGDYLPTIMEATDSTQLRRWFVDKVATACRNIGSKREERSNSSIEVAITYIKNNYDRNISLDDVSRIVNISPYYFSKIFKDETGENFIEYLTAIRIDKAKELIADGKYSMKEICTMVGYSDPNYFSRLFKKNVGVTPTEYREGK